MSQTQAIDALLQLVNSPLSPETKLSAFKHPDKNDLDITLLNRIEGTNPANYDELCTIAGISDQIIDIMLEALKFNSVLDDNGQLRGEYILNLGRDGFMPRQGQTHYPQRETLNENWVHDKLALIFEIEPYKHGYLVLPRKQGQEQYSTALIFEPSLAPDSWDALPETELPSEFTPDIYDIAVDGEEKKTIDRIRLRKLSDEHIEIATADFKWIFCGAGNGANPFDTPDEKLSDEEQQLFNERTQELAKEALIEKKRDADHGHEPLNELPQWWDDKDTKELLQRLGEELKRKANPKIMSQEKVAGKIIEKAAARVLAKMLTNKERRIAYHRLITKGSSPEKAARMAERLAKRLYKYYLCQHPILLQRFSVFTNFSHCKQLLTSPKVWARTAAAKVFIKGLGVQIIDTLGLINDLYTINDALYVWHQNAKTWEAARESYRQATQLEGYFKNIREQMTHEQQQFYQQKEKQRRDDYKKLKDAHKQKIEARLACSLPNFQTQEELEKNHTPTKGYY